MFDMAQGLGVRFDSSTERLIGFESLNHESGRRFAFISEPFFVPVHQFHQWVVSLLGWVRGASARWVCSCDQSFNSHSLRLFSFESETGGFKTGAITMANQKNNSQKKTVSKELLNSADSLNHVKSRLEFIMDTLCAPSDWIEDRAATGLYYTLESINKEITAIKSTISAEVTA